jgi:DNA-binding beta-propeller fold protein YncE
MPDIDAPVPAPEPSPAPPAPVEESSAPAASPAASPAGDIALSGGAAVVVPEEDDRRRRRKWFFLFVLLVLLTIVSLITGWYLIFRKPIDEILPPISTEKVPHFSFSIYELDRPVGVAVTPDGGRIYVTEAGGDRAVHVFDGRGQAAGELIRPGTEPGSRIPVYVAIDPINQDVYVSDRLVGAIDIYGSDNAYKGTFQPDPAIPDWQPLGLAFDKSGTLYVSDVSGDPHRVLAFGRDRKLIRTIAVAEKLNFPNGLAIDALGDVVIADGNNGRIVIVSPSDTLVGTIPRGFSPGELALPRGAAIDDSGRLYVSDTSGQVVQMYRLDPKTGVPTYIATVGHEGVAEDGFEYPHGLAVDARAHIYIADWANDRLDVWSY